MEKKNSNQDQDSKKSVDKKQTGSDKIQALGKKHDSGEDTKSQIPDRKKEINDDPNETSKKIPHMNQKN